jgi:hypothetical protein
MRFLANNYVLDSDCSATNENTGYKFQDALTDTRLSRFARSTGTATDIIADLGATYQINYIAIAGHNLSPTAIVTLYGNSTNDFVNPPVSFTVNYEKVITQAIADPTIDDSQFFFLIDENNNYIVDENDNYIVGLIYGSTYRYWKISISDPDNVDGYIELSKIYLGDYLQLPAMAKSQKIPTASTSTRTENSTGQTFGDKGIVYKYGSITLPFVDDDNKLAIDQTFNVIDKIVPFFLLIWENDLTFQPALYSILTTDIEWQRVEGVSQRYWSATLNFKETF